jgi:hypothetical protein
VTLIVVKLPDRHVDINTIDGCLCFDVGVGLPVVAVGDEQGAAVETDRQDLKGATKLFLVPADEAHLDVSEPGGTALAAGHTVVLGKAKGLYAVNAGVR